MGEPSEVAIGGAQCLDSVVAAHGRDSRVMHLAANDPTVHE
jgi:hypothetical protein